MKTVRRMRMVALLALMAIGLVATTAAPVGAVNIFADDQGRYALGIADGWVQTTPASGQLAAWSVDGGAALFNIVYVSVPAGTTSVDLAKKASSGLGDYANYTEQARDFVKCADQDCPRLDFTARDNGGETQRVWQTYVTKGTDGWIITFRTRASDLTTYKGDAELMLYSFTI